jgi:hypothetical protein
MTTKKTKTTSAKPQWDMKTNGESSDESQKNYYYDYYSYNNHYAKEEVKKEAFATITCRGKRLIQNIAEICVGIAIGLIVYCVVSTAISVKNIEKVLDKKDAPVHTVSSTTKPQTK